MPDGGEGERGIVFADTAGVFAEAPSERPVQCIFDGPVTACMAEDACGVWGIVGDIEACFDRGFAADEAGGGDTDNAL